MNVQYHATYKAVVNNKYQIRISTQHDGWVLRIVDHMTNRPYFIQNSFLTPDDAKEAAQVWIDQQGGRRD